MSPGPAAGPVAELVGVYDADGGLLGEAAYVWGRARGTRHCSLCDITHGTWRRKPEWDAMAATLPVPVRLLHRNELTDDLAVAARRATLPAVLGRTPSGWKVVVGDGELTVMSGSVEALGALLRERLAGPA